MCLRINFISSKLAPPSTTQIHIGKCCTITLQNCKNNNNIMNDHETLCILEKGECNIFSIHNTNATIQGQGHPIQTKKFQSQRFLANQQNKQNYCKIAITGIVVRYMKYFLQKKTSAYKSCKIVLTFILHPVNTTAISSNKAVNRAHPESRQEVKRLFVQYSLAEMQHYQIGNIDNGNERRHHKMSAKTLLTRFAAKQSYQMHGLPEFIKLNLQQYKLQIIIFVIYL